MSLRNKLKESSYFRPFKIPEWDTGDSVYSLRILPPDDLASISDYKSEDNMERGLYTFSLLFGDEKGKRVYQSTPEDFAEIKATIPLNAISKIIEAGMLANSEELKKN